MDLFRIMFSIVFFMFVAMFLSIFVKSISQRRRDDASPRLTVDATVVAKRTLVRGDHAHTTYFATFQVESGDRMELTVPHDRFGYLVEGDKGRLTFQGSRFLDFERP